MIDLETGKTHLTGMSVEVTISSKGQVVIPKDVRDALGLKAGEKLQLSHHGRQITLDASKPSIERISYEEFRRRVPRYEGPPISIEDMSLAVDRMIAKRGAD